MSASTGADVEALDRGAKDKPFTYKIVDADAHVNPHPSFWQEYLPKHLRELAPRIEHADDADYVIFEGSRKKLNLMGQQAGRKGKDFKLEGRLSDVRSGGWEPAARLADMDLDGMDAAVLYGGGPLGTLNMELYIESFRAYNRFLADFCAYDRRRLCGAAYLPMRSAEEGLAMLKEAVDLGFTTVNIPGFPQSTKDTAAPSATGASQSMGAQAAALTGDPFGELRYDDPSFDKFWAAACDYDIALTVHLGGRIVRFAEKDKILADMMMSKFAMAEPVAILIFSGIFQRFPKLKFGTIESGSGWMAFAAHYMDRTWEKQRYWTESPLKEPPSFYMDQNVYTSFINDRIAVETRHFPGAKNIMWSSDYPHSETTFPDSAAVIARDMAGIPEADKHAIICGNAQKFFRIGE
ncbi:amidohydrolase family protein [Sphingomonas montanisoli]|uniref:Amidohydrolase n=1 Tax=Sphingomonas montanisoli TaxID=2606412 RepID=A0A5D9C6B2_9SPHN|nr:amidohydrolase family protein [Sphingomonas montanisoli]TZG27388.1 amidohydrolase [Sphingomonas montanisoli]